MNVMISLLKLLVVERMGNSRKRKIHANNDVVNKWVTVPHKSTGKSQAWIDHTDNQPKTRPVVDDSTNVWDIYL